MTQGATEQQPGTVTLRAGWVLFALLGGSVAWTLHFLGAYAVAAIGCVARWRGIRESLALGTVALAIVALWSTLVAWRAWRQASAGQPWDSALGEPRGWFAFLMLTGALLGGISAFTILLEGFGTLMLPVCGWNAR